MPLAPRCLLGPRHIHPGVNTEEDYRRAQAAAIAKGRAAYPNMEWRDPWVAAARPPVYIVGGMWQIKCATPGCGNCPSVSPEWRVALCWDCGAVYEGLELPADLDAIARVLLCRPALTSRNWTTETVDALCAENLAHGDPTPDEGLT